MMLDAELTRNILQLVSQTWNVFLDISSVLYLRCNILPHEFAQNEMHLQKALCKRVKFQHTTENSKQTHLERF